MTETPLAVDRSELAERLHEDGCANLAACPGRVEHERAQGISFLALVDYNLAAGWTPAIPSDGTSVPIPGGAAVVSVKKTNRPEPKAIFGMVGAGLGYALGEVAIWVLSSPSALDALQLSPAARFGVLILATAVSALYGAYRARSAVAERTRVTPVGNAAETTAVITLGPEPMTAAQAEQTGEHFFESYRHTAQPPTQG